MRRDPGATHVQPFQTQTLSATLLFGSGLKLSRRLYNLVLDPELNGKNPVHFLCRAVSPLVAKNAYLHLGRDSCSVFNSTAKKWTSRRIFVTKTWKQLKSSCIHITKTWKGLKPPCIHITKIWKGLKSPCIHITKTWKVCWIKAVVQNCISGIKLCNQIRRIFGPFLAQIGNKSHKLFD